MFLTAKTFISLSIRDIQAIAQTTIVCIIAYAIIGLLLFFRLCHIFTATAISTCCIHMGCGDALCRRFRGFAIRRTAFVVFSGIAEQVRITDITEASTLIETT
jgi:hypothetical protein